MDAPLLIVGCGLAIVLALAIFVPMGKAFSRELRYVTMKLQNSRTDTETAYWEKRKKDLWKSLLPFHHYDHH